MSKNLRIISFKEEEEIIKVLDDVVKSKGIDRSAFIREAVRKRLAELSYFSADIKKALGVVTKAENQDMTQVSKKDIRDLARLVREARQIIRGEDAPNAHAK